jgi:hypothetical protein
VASDKLYFHGSCLACRGSGKTWYGRPCPYCHAGTAFHEASDELIKDYVLESMSEESKRDLLSRLQEQENKEEEV